ncbi:MAG: Holliday junction branch migration protein RuvA [Planctomycetes bacterium]|nr:Holliday junction branch migration protein RuvA [Planctomycetota bacterium]
MYNHLSGVVFEKKLGEVILDINGVGYSIQITDSTYKDLPSKGEQAFVYVYLQVRETELSFYGFSAPEERALFLNFIKVSGVGPSLSLQILNQASLQMLVPSVIGGDIAFLTRLKGIGKKTAERIVVELRDRLKSIPMRPEMQSTISTSYPEDAYLALLALGLQAEAARDKLQKIAEISPPPEKTDDWIRLALKRGK